MPSLTFLEAQDVILHVCSNPVKDLVTFNFYSTQSQNNEQLAINVARKHFKCSMVATDTRKLDQRDPETILAINYVDYDNKD